ncbi:MAG: Flp family type IVb pilin [Xanthobacteraceae bacterium]
MGRSIKCFVQDKSGATAIEYAIIAGSLSIVILVSVNAIGSAVQGIFGQVAAGFTTLAR